MRVVSFVFWVGACFWGNQLGFGYVYNPVKYEVLVETNDIYPVHPPYFLYISQKNNTIFFKKPNITRHMECPRVLANDQAYLAQLDRIAYKDELDLKTDCHSIKSRNYFANEPSTIEEANFPIAIIRVVYKDYLMLEMELAAEYAPQNTYVYVLDRKSPYIFHSRIKDLAYCFPNVYVLPTTFDMNSAGKNMNYALMESLKFLTRPRFDWKYVMFLQNHDIMLRTNYELVQIFRFYNGTNDIEVNPPWDWLLNRIEPELDWTFAGLNFFKNTTRNTHAKINFSKGYAAGSLSREMAEFIIKELNLTKLLAQLENGRYGIDEQLLATLNSDDNIQIPGGFTHKCNDEGLRTDCATRAAFWEYDQECRTGISRHAVCIMGMEDLPELVKLPYFTINKFLPSFDFGALTCWYEHLFNKTHLKPPNPNKLNMSFYETLNHVRFNHERWSNPDFKPWNFECRPDGALNYKKYYFYSSYYRYHYFS